MPDTQSLPFVDTVNAWVPHGHFTVAPSGSGPLDGLRFAAKDLFDVAGHPTGAGNPQWLASHPVPTAHSQVVARLLAAGATLCGKTLTDELAYSIHGDNLHYGMPLNSAAPDRVPGGSSSGSVAAVAARLVDFALGTDTGGSTRVPASYCGVWGLRTTHGLLSTSGLVPLHPGFDTVTWFAHEAASFERVGQVLLPADHRSFSRVLCFDDAWALADAAFGPLLHKVHELLRETMGSHGGNLRIAGDGLEAWRQTYVTAGAFEGWQIHGEWISSTQPQFAPAIAARWHQAAMVTAKEAASARLRMAGIRAHVREILGEDGVAVIPSAASAAPLRTAAGGEIDDIRTRTLRISCIAGLAGLPQVNIPLQDPAGVPLGISLLGPAGSDAALIRLAIAIHRQIC